MIFFHPGQESALLYRSILNMLTDTKIRQLRILWVMPRVLVAA